MTLDELIKLMSKFVERLQVDNFTFGAVAMNFWIPPRFTNDLDMVMCIKKGVLGELVWELNAIGFRVTTDLKRKLGEGRILKLPIGDTRFDLKLCTSDHDYATLDRAQLFVQGPYTLNVASAEDIVLYKLQSWRSQDRTDIENIVSQYTPLDTVYIESWLGRIEADSGAPMRARWDSMVES